MDLHVETVTPMLMDVLRTIMGNALFNPFRLVGGTSLSLRLGHRKSADIDLFSDEPYGSLDFSVFETYFRNTYSYVDMPDHSPLVGFGRSYYVGMSETNCVKVDLFYKDGIIDPCEVLNGLRMASLNDVIAMKVDVVLSGGRKKDFWDLHELLPVCSMDQMMELHRLRNEYTHDRSRLLAQFQDFSLADNDPDPICLKGKLWEFIKLDFVTEVELLIESSK